MDKHALDATLARIAALMDMSEHESALEQCVVLIDDHATRRAGLRVRSEIHARMKDRDRAIADLEGLVCLGDVEPSDRFNLGVLLWRAGRLDDAARSFKRSIDIGFEEGFHYYSNAAAMHLAGVLILLGRPEEALECCEVIPDGYSSYLPVGVRTKEQLIEEACTRAGAPGRGLPHEGDEGLNS